MATHYIQKYASAAAFAANSPEKPNAMPVGSIVDADGHANQAMIITATDSAYGSAAPFNLSLSKIQLTPTSTVTALTGLNAIRGEVGLTAAKSLSGTSFVAGVYGRANIFGTVDIGSGDLAAVMGKMDLNGSTLTSGHIAPVQGNIVNPPASALTTVNLAYLESAGGNPINSFVQCFGKATYVFDLASNTHTQMSTTGTAGATATKGWLKVLVEGVVRYIPLTDSVS
jgi:hypothetical protein